MTWGLSTGLRTTRITAVRDALDAGSGGGLLRLYNGTKPAVGGTATTLQCTVPLSDPCGSIAGQTLTFTPAADGIRIDDETITWARFVDSAGNFVMDCTVTVAGGGGDIEITSVTGAIGTFVRMLAGSLSD